MEKKKMTSEEKARIKEEQKKAEAERKELAKMERELIAAQKVPKEKKPMDWVLVRKKINKGLKPAALISAIVAGITFIALAVTMLATLASGGGLFGYGPRGPQGPAGGYGPPGQNGTNGTNGRSPSLRITDGYWYINLDDGEGWQQVIDHLTDEPIRALAKDGLIPYIGPAPERQWMMRQWQWDDVEEDWIVVSVPTGIRSEAIDGETPYIGDDGNWHIAGLPMLDVELRPIRAVAPVLTIEFAGDPERPFFHINGQFTGFLAEGVQGEQGIQGHIPYIFEGNWWINGVDQNIRAEGVDGYTAFIGADGDWWVGYFDASLGTSGEWVGVHATGVRAQGPQGPIGPEGPKGDQGAPGEPGLNAVVDSVKFQIAIGEPQHVILDMRTVTFTSHTVVGSATLVVAGGIEVNMPFGRMVLGVNEFSNTRNGIVYMARFTVATFEEGQRTRITFDSLSSSNLMTFTHQPSVALQAGTKALIDLAFIPIETNKIARVESGKIVIGEDIETNVDATMLQLMESNKLNFIAADAFNLSGRAVGQVLIVTSDNEWRVISFDGTGAWTLNSQSGGFAALIDTVVTGPGGGWNMVGTSIITFQII
ncbi:MAG: hypothetical protein FWD89_04380 [Firmicutes bacterium]|nr:hypothetical protein [Bacillota bacterium]